MAAPSRRDQQQVRRLIMGHALQRAVRVQNYWPNRNVWEDLKIITTA